MNTMMKMTNGTCPAGLQLAMQPFPLTFDLVLVHASGSRGAHLRTGVSSPCWGALRVTSRVMVRAQRVEHDAARYRSPVFTPGGHQDADDLVKRSLALGLKIHTRIEGKIFYPAFDDGRSSRRRDDVLRDSKNAARAASSLRLTCWKDVQACVRSFFERSALLAGRTACTQERTLVKPPPVIEISFTACSPASRQSDLAHCGHIGV